MLRGMRTRTKQKSVARATVLGARAPRAEFFVFSAPHVCAVSCADHRNVSFLRTSDHHEAIFRTIQNAS